MPCTPGMFGGPVLDAPTLLSRLIATLHDADGNVAVDGLVSRDDVDVDLTEAEYRADASVLDGVRLAGTGSIASRLWTKPALSIIGFDAPAVDVASNTLLPRARAKFSLRLAPGQDPAEAMDAVRRHVEAQRALRRQGGLHAGGERQRVPDRHLRRRAASPCGRSGKPGASRPWKWASAAPSRSSPT